MSSSPRPLSPHLTIYRPQISSVLSILHRITGCMLYFGTLLLIAFICVVAYFPEHYQVLRDFLSGVEGRLALFGWAFGFFLHLFNGIRHLFWDMGKGFDIPTVNKTGVLSVICAIISSLAVFAIAYHNAGIL